MKQNYTIEKNVLTQSNFKEICYVLMASIVAALIPAFFFYVGNLSSAIPLVKPICYLIGTANIIVMVKFLIGLIKALVKG